VISGRASGLPRRKHDLKRRLALDLGLALDEEQVEADAVQWLATGCRVVADVVQGRGRRDAGTRDEAQGRGRRSAGTQD
jgi:hypothetical protein